MFSGIVEATSLIQKVEEHSHLIRIWIERPLFFDDIKNGDSIAVNGVCLTVEDFDQNSLRLALGFETLKLLQLKASDLQGRKVNLERSLRFGDRMHGHLVSGHVEARGRVEQKTWQGDSLILKISVPSDLRPSLWKKGSVAVQGVSLTVNEVGAFDFEVCLIPETLNQTNLKDLNPGDGVNIETDYLAKAMFEKWKFWRKENNNGI